MLVNGGVYVDLNKRRQSGSMERGGQREATIYDEVEKDMSPEFLSYIHELVKPVKGVRTPKGKRVERGEEEEEGEGEGEDGKGGQTGRSIEEMSVEKIPVRIDKVEMGESGDRRELRSSIKYLENLTQSQSGRKQSELVEVMKKMSSEQKSFDLQDNKSFIEGMERYVQNLQRQSKERERELALQEKTEKSRARDLSRSNQKAILDELSVILDQNKMLKTRLQLYESRFQQIQVAVFTLIELSQNKQKSLRKEIKELNKALKLAIDKMNVQEEELVELRGFFSDFQNQLKVYNSQRFKGQSLNLFTKKHRRDLLTEEREGREVREFGGLKTQEYPPHQLSEDRYPSTVCRGNLYTPSTYSRPKVSSCMLPSKNPIRAQLPSGKHHSKQRNRKGSENTDLFH